MAKMRLPKPSPETIAYFERIAPGPPIEARKLFGMPTRFLNGHMLVGLFGDTFMLHLSQSDREECIRAGAKPFAPMGRESKGYVDVKPGTFDDRTLKEWIVRGMRYLATLPPKLKPRAADGGGASSKRDGAAAAARKPTRNDTAARRTAPKTAPKTAAKRERAGARKAEPKSEKKTRKAAPARALPRASRSSAKKANSKTASAKKTRAKSRKARR
jgi:hypothetical protein